MQLEYKIDVWRQSEKIFAIFVRRRRHFAFHLPIVLRIKNVQNLHLRTPRNVILFSGHFPINRLRVLEKPVLLHPEKIWALGLAAASDLKRQFLVFLRRSKTDLDSVLELAEGFQLMNALVAHKFGIRVVLVDAQLKARLHFLSETLRHGIFSEYGNAQFVFRLAQSARFSDAAHRSSFGATLTSRLNRKRFTTMNFRCKKYSQR